MNLKTIGAGVFPDLTAGNGLFWLIARGGDPRVAGHVVIYLWEGDRVDLARELAQIAVPAGSPAFPRIYLHRGELWFAYHDGSIGILRNATTSETIPLSPCQNNDPICFGGRYVAWQGAQANGWPITRMSLTSREKAAAGNGQGTGLSRITEDGRVILVDADRQVIPGGTRPAWAGDLVVIEKHGNRGALARLEDGREAFLWPEVQIITPRCAYEPSLDLYAVAGWSEGDGLIRAAVLRDADFKQPSVPVPVPQPTPPPQPTPQPTPNPTPEPPMSELGTVQRIRAKYPTPLGAKHAAFLLELATALGNGAGLLRKDGGTNITLPDETTVAQDIICYPGGRIFDVLRDGEGDAEPTWGEANGSPVETSRYYRVSDATPQPNPNPTPTPTPTPSPDLAALTARVKALEDLVARIQADDAKPIALKSAHGRYLCAEPDGRVIADRQGRGAWEQFTVER